MQRPRRPLSARSTTLIELVQDCLRFFKEAHRVFRQVHDRKAERAQAELDVIYLNQLLEDQEWTSELVHRNLEERPYISADEEIRDDKAWLLTS